MKISTTFFSKLVFIAFMPVLFAACASKEPQPTDNQLAYLENEIIALKTEIAQLKEEMIPPQKEEVIPDTAGGKVVLPNPPVGSKQIQKEEKKVLPKPVPVVPTPPIAELPSDETTHVAILNSVQQPAPPMELTKLKVSETQAYEMALKLYQTGKFEQSEKAFDAFLEVYPSSKYAPNALYWKGECYYARGQYGDAILAFKDVQARFPKHVKTADSLLKTALAYSKLKDEANAALHTTVLLEDWGNSDAAKRAKSLNLSHL